ncbi:hypothetical protein [Streptosporangium canum]|uniref:hypothetical protein n=1 Tax=Streptosporangium canum TaxID=324952 RepID=UPI00343C3F4C
MGDPSHRTINGILAAETDQGGQAARRAGDGGAGTFLRGPQELFNHDAAALDAWDIPVS